MNSIKFNLTNHLVLIALVSIVSLIVGCTASLPTALHDAARRGDISAIENQLGKGVDVNAKNKYDQTALMKAAWTGKIETIKLLIDKGADVNAKDNNGRTALMTAAKSSRSNIETLKLLIDKGADVNAKDNDGQTAFMLAASSGQIENVKLLIDKGNDVNAKDNSGQTVLMKAASLVSLGQIETIKLLIDKGADVNAKDNDGQTAFMLAASSGQIGTVKLLIDKGADIIIPSGKAILITESDPVLINRGKVKLGEIDGRKIDLGDSSMTMLSSGNHKITVSYKRDTLAFPEKGKPRISSVMGDFISLNLNVKSGHIYAVRYRIKDKKWIAWIDIIK